MVSNLNLYGRHSFDDQCKGVVAHVGALLNAQEYERVRGLIEGLAWLNRSAYDQLIRVYGVHIKTVMTSTASQR